MGSAPRSAIVGSCGAAEEREDRGPGVLSAGHATCPEPTDVSSVNPHRQEEAIPSPTFQMRKQKLSEVKALCSKPHILNTPKPSFKSRAPPPPETNARLHPQEPTPPTHRPPPPAPGFLTRLFSLDNWGLARETTSSSMKRPSFTKPHPGAPALGHVHTLPQPSHPGFLRSTGAAQKGCGLFPFPGALHLPPTPQHLRTYWALSRIGPKSALRTHMGRPVWTASNHFTTISPGRQGGEVSEK